MKQWEVIRRRDGRVLAAGKSEMSAPKCITRAQDMSPDCTFITYDGFALTIKHTAACHEDREQNPDEQLRLCERSG